MARFSVDIPESARTWREQGMRCIVRDRPETEWPAPWNAFWAKCHEGCHAVWTYRALGDDLQGLGDGSRRDSLLQCIKIANWPKGSISFWPCALSCSDDASKGDNNTQAGPFEDPYMFFAGLRALRPRIVCFFEDRDAFSTGFLETLTTLHPSGSCYFLPSLNSTEANLIVQRNAAIAKLPSP